VATTRPNGKGDRPRKVNGPKYRDNYDAIVWNGCPPDWDYPEGSKTKKQRMDALLYCIDQDIANPETIRGVALEEFKRDIMKCWTPDKEILDEPTPETK
jgi:hypothetical protein